jgi:PTS system N-acetylglucosamine-specific IIC component
VRPHETWTHPRSTATADSGANAGARHPRRVLLLRRLDRLPLDYNIAERPLLLLPIGLVYPAVYVIFRCLIRRFDLMTPGREPDDTDGSAASSPSTAPAVRR